MTLIREASGRWQVEQPTPFDVPSSTGLKFVLNGQTAKRKTDITCERKVSASKVRTAANWSSLFRRSS